MSLKASASRDEKKEALVELVREALLEQQKPTRIGYHPVPDFPFAPRVNQTYWRESLAHVLKMTEALELLAEMVGAVDGEVE